MTGYRKGFHAAVVIVYGNEGAGEMDATPHVNRHTAAVHCSRDLKWQDTKVQHRGRWAEAKSMRWDHHSHLQVKNESRLSSEQLKEGAEIWQDPVKGFSFLLFQCTRR